MWVLTALPLLSGCTTSLDKPAQIVAAPTLTKSQPLARPTGILKPAKLAAQPKAAKPTYLDIKTLKGKASDQVTKLLGAPDFRRTDKPAELWQYRHDKCSVDLFFYPHDGGNLSVDFLDVRTYGHQDLSPQACFVAILKSRAAADGRG